MERRVEEIATAQCRQLLEANGVGRVAVWTSEGPVVIPVNYVVKSDAVLFRTAPYTVLGSLAWDTTVAFEIDQIDAGSEEGWSVLVVGHGDRVEDPDEVAELRDGLEPWAGGVRNLFVRVHIGRITGRRVHSR